MKLREEQAGKLLDLLDRLQEVHPEAPKMHRGKVSRFIKFNMDNPKVLMLVNKEVTATLVLMVHQDAFSIQQQITDLVFYSETTGGGFRLLKEAQKWVDGWGKGVYCPFLSTSSSRPDVDDMIGRSGLIKIGTQFKFRTGEE